MSDLSHSSVVSPTQLEARSLELIHEYRAFNSKQTDRVFFWLMAGQWLFSLVIALFVTPYTWIGETQFVHAHVWMALVFGGLISVPTMIATRLWPGSKTTCYMVAIAQGMWTGLLIHLTGGRIETHFHAFVSLAFLTLYRDWRVLVVSTLVITADHAVRGTLWPLSVYGVAVDSTWRFLEHVAWVGWLDTILVLGCVRQDREARNICERRAELELTNVAIEDRIRQRTEELEIANQDLQREYEAREKLNDELVSASRKAGMAEIATGVLHNIGNVLNSLNVSAQVLTEKLADSKVDRLRKAADIVLEHRDDLGVFVTEDRRGKFLPEMMDQISDNLMEERDAELEELRNVKNSISHVREIIHNQQQVARCSIAVGRKFNLDDTIEEAVRMSEADRGVELTIQSEGDSSVVLDKHLLLQILVNLLSNANQSVLREAERRSESGDTSFEPVIRVESFADESGIRVSVVDNGIGISAENLSGIFQHGFTTRDGGHGFGLHSSALHARTLGGKIDVSSDGDGLGATFAVYLPQSNQKVNATGRSVLGSV